MTGRELRQKRRDDRIRRAVLDDLRMFMSPSTATNPLQVIDEYAALKGLNYETATQPRPRFIEFARTQPGRMMTDAEVIAQKTAYTRAFRGTYHHVFGLSKYCGDCGEPFDSEKHQAQCLQP